MGQDTIVQNVSQNTTYQNQRTMKQPWQLP